MENTYLPPMCYTLSRKEKLEFCQCFAGIKVSSGNSSNIRSHVSMKDLKLAGLKSHDYHALMQQLLTVVIYFILLKNVCHAITQLYVFFNVVCRRVIDSENWLSCRRILWLCCVSLSIFFTFIF